MALPGHAVYSEGKLVLYLWGVLLSSSPFSWKLRLHLKCRRCGQLCVRKDCLNESHQRVLCVEGLARCAAAPAAAHAVGGLVEERAVQVYGRHCLSPASTTWARPRVPAAAGGARAAARALGGVPGALGRGGDGGRLRQLRGGPQNARAAPHAPGILSALPAAAAAQVRSTA